jgi:hypothetical protein
VYRHCCYPIRLVYRHCYYSINSVHRPCCFPKTSVVSQKSRICPKNLVRSNKKDEMGGVCSRYGGEERNNFWLRRPEGHKIQWKDNIKMHKKYKVRGGRYKCESTERELVGCCEHLTGRGDNFLTSWETTSLSKRNLTRSVTVTVAAQTVHSNPTMKQ